MRHGLDIADVEAQTKIRAKYLRALENEEWGLLPGPTFVRTFLRTYAEAVGLDPHVLVDAYRVANDDQPEPEPAAQTPPRGPRTPRGPRPDRSRARAPGPPSPLVLIGGAVVVVVLFLVVLGLVGNDSNDNSDRAAKSTPTATARAKPKPKKAPRKAPPRAPAGVNVRIEPSVPTYACLDAGEGTERVFEGTLSKARTFRNAKELRINLGKRSVKLTANGKPVTVAQSADPYGLRVTKGAAQEITDGPRPCA